MVEIPPYPSKVQERSNDTAACQLGGQETPLYMPVIELSQRLLESLTSGEKQKEDFFDSTTKGLMVQVRASGRKTFYFRERGEDGKTSQVKIADVDHIRLNEVRTLIKQRKAAQTQAALAAFANPYGETPAAQPQLKEPDVSSPLLATFVREAYLPYIRTYKRSYSCDVSLLNNHVLPFFGDKHLHEIGKTDLVAFINTRRATHKPGTINRVIILMRYIYNLALKWETPGVDKNRISGTPLLEEGNKKERFLTSEEVDRLVYCVKMSRNPMLRYIVPGLILTGARKQELLKSRWSDFDFDTKIWRIPMSKSGRARHVPISDALALLLESIPKTCEWVFANPKTLKPFISFFYSWDTARRQAGLDDVRVHDLRHSFASFLVNNGRSLYEVQRILGHTQIKTTQRYAHLDQNSLLSAVNEIIRAAPNILGEGSRPKHLPELRRAPAARTGRESKRKACPLELEMIARAEALRRGIAF